MHPQIFEQKKLSLAGIKKEFKELSPSAAAALWQQFLPRLSEISDATGDYCYGVIRTHGNKTEYFCGIEVSSLKNIPKDMHHCVVPSSTYARFKHSGPADTIWRTVQSVYSKWLPLCHWKHNRGPDLEIYDLTYDPLAADSYMYYAIPILEGSTS